MLSSSFFIPDFGLAVVELQKVIGELNRALDTKPGFKTLQI